MDPVVGDIGYAVIADSDISSVKASKGAATPGSLRKFDLSDAIYVGGILNGTPQQYVEFTDQGITVTDTNGNEIQMTSSGVNIADTNGNQIQMTSAGITLIGNVIVRNNIELAGALQGSSGGTYSGTISTTGDVLAGSISLTNHLHTGVATGSSNTGPAFG
jgi:hypothetical protein